jgi:molybdopterin molybdotransferase
MGKFKRLLPYPEALDIIKGHALPLPSEAVGILSSRGRIVAADVVSDSASPPFDRAAMDGFAVIAADTQAAGARLAIVDSLSAGSVPSRTVAHGEAIRVMTGAMMPNGADAVLMQEYASDVDGDSIAVNKAVAPGTHISRKGEDIAQGQVVLRRGTLLAPEHVALLASLGIPSVHCHIMPRVAIIVTGDELVSPGSAAPEGSIIDTNSGMLASIATACGCAVCDCLQVPDDPEALRDALVRVRASSDIVLVTGGSSFGDKDYAREVIGGLVFHGVAVKPGKPFGFSAGTPPVFMMSGYPVAAFMQMYLFFIPYLEASTGASLLTRVALPAGEQLATSLGRAEVVRARVLDGVVMPIRRSGSSKLSSLAWADGYVLSSQRDEGITKGDTYLFTYFKI